MILIADSGSSKTDWRVITHDNKVHQTRTVGFNPYYQTKEDMELGLQTPDLLSWKDIIREVYFYGSGCTSETNKETAFTKMPRYMWTMTLWPLLGLPVVMKQELPAY